LLLPAMRGPRWRACSRRSHRLAVDESDLVSLSGTMTSVAASLTSRLPAEPSAAPRTARGGGRSRVVDHLRHVQRGTEGVLTRSGPPRTDQRQACLDRTTPHYPARHQTGRAASVVSKEGRGQLRPRGRCAGPSRRGRARHDAEGLLRSRRASGGPRTRRGRPAPGPEPRPGAPELSCPAGRAAAECA
jgi:hypothetical protein